jgi:hypothetical protein
MIWPGRGCKIGYMHDMTMTDSHGAAKWRDSELTWVAIQEAVQEQRHKELAEIAVSLYGQLGEAKAEVSRLRAWLWSCLWAPSATGPDVSPVAAGRDASITDPGRHIYIPREAGSAKD